MILPKRLTGWVPKLTDYQSGAYKSSPELRQALGGSSKVWDVIKDQRLVATGSVQIFGSIDALDASRQDGGASPARRQRSPVFR